MFKYLKRVYIYVNDFQINIYMKWSNYNNYYLTYTSSFFKIQMFSFNILKFLFDKDKLNLIFKFDFNLSYY